MIGAQKARAVGVNHVALEVGDIDKALAFYRRLFDFELRGKSATSLRQVRYWHRADAKQGGPR